MSNLSNVSNKEPRKKRKTHDIRSKLDIIKDAILKNVPVKTLYLFGSYAYGKPNKKSDIDIYGVIPDDFDKNIIDTMGEIANHIYPYGLFNVDLFLVKENKFLFYKENSSFEETIYNKGIILYENSRNS
jgi:predicted nucleotidyltransferase